MQKSQQLKVTFLLKGMALMGYAAINLADKDLQYGRDFLIQMRDEYKLPFISANIFDTQQGSLLADPYVIKSFGETKIGIFGVATDKGVEGFVTPELGFELRDPIATAKSAVNELQPQCDVIIALAHLGLAGAYDLAEQVSGIDIIVSGHQGQHLRSPKTVGSTVIMQGGSQGKYLGQLDFTVSNGTVLDVQGKTEPLSASIEDDPQLAAVVTEFDDALLSAFPLETPIATASASKFSERSCKMCHLKEHTQWTSTLHSHAWETLVREKQNHNPECQQCHTTMYQETNGFTALSESPEMVNVQCSECHRLAGDDILTHIKRARTRQKESSANGVSQRDFMRISEQTCLKCHNEDNSPSFDYKTFLSKVTH